MLRYRHKCNFSIFDFGYHYFPLLVQIYLYPHFLSSSSSSSSSHLLKGIRDMGKSSKEPNTYHDLLPTLRTESHSRRFAIDTIAVGVAALESHRRARSERLEKTRTFNRLRHLLVSQLVTPPSTSCTSNPYASRRSRTISQSFSCNST